MMAIVECPKCKHHFNSKETFSWRDDQDGFPTIESIFCPKCKATNTGELAEYDWDDFKVVGDGKATLYDYWEEWVMTDPGERGECGKYSAFCAGWQAALKSKEEKP